MEVRLAPLSEELLHWVEEFTDGVAGGMKILVPVNFDGNRIVSRETIYIGWTNIQTTRGPVQIEFPIEAKTRREAFEKWQAVGEAAVRKWLEDLQSSQIKKAILDPGGRRQ